MIPSEDCFQRLWGCSAYLQAGCWDPCGCWRRRTSKRWIDPELGPPKHFDKHRPFFEVDEDGPKGVLCCFPLHFSAIQYFIVCTSIGRVHNTSDITILSRRCRWASQSVESRTIRLVHEAISQAVDGGPGLLQIVTTSGSASFATSEAAGKQQRLAMAVHCISGRPLRPQHCDSAQNAIPGSRLAAANAEDLNRQILASLAAHCQGVVNCHQAIPSGMSAGF